MALIKTAAPINHTPTSDSEFNSRHKSKDPHFQFVVSIQDYNFWKVVDNKCRRWLLSNVGINHEDWEWWWDGSVRSYKFEFKHEEDKVKFILRWL